MVEQCGSSLFHGLAADSFRTSYWLENVCVCVSESERARGERKSMHECVAASCSNPLFPHISICHTLLGYCGKKNNNYISLNNSCRESSCYQVHTCSTKSSKWKLTIAMWQRTSSGNCFQCSLCCCIVKVRSYAETDRGVFILYLFFILFDLFLSIIGQGTRITHPLHICYAVFFLTTCWKVVQSPSVFVKLHLLREFV